MFHQLELLILRIVSLSDYFYLVSCISEVLPGTDIITTHNIYITIFKMILACIKNIITHSN